MTSADEKNARALLERIEVLDAAHEKRLEDLEVFSKALLVEFGQLKHRLSVLIATTAHTGPTERPDGCKH